MMADSSDTNMMGEQDVEVASPKEMMQGVEYSLMKTHAEGDFDTTHAGLLTDVIVTGSINETARNLSGGEPKQFGVDKEVEVHKASQTAGSKVSPHLWSFRMIARANVRHSCVEAVIKVVKP